MVLRRNIYISDVRFISPISNEELAGRRRVVVSTLISLYTLIFLFQTMDENNNVSKTSLLCSICGKDFQTKS